MATESFFHNVVINNEQQLERLIEAIEISKDKSENLDTNRIVSSVKEIRGRRNVKAFLARSIEGTN